MKQIDPWDDLVETLDRRLPWLVCKGILWAYGIVLLGSFVLFTLLAVLERL